VTATYKLSAQKVEIIGVSEIGLSVGGSSIKIDPGGVTIQTPGIVTVEGSLIKHNG
jgi:uncharacterized protein (DUF2345 family)